MSEYSFDWTVERDDDATIDVVVTYEVTPYVPARIYGDYPRPAEGGNIEITSVVLCGAGPNSEQVDLTDEEMKAIVDEAERRADDDISDEEAAEADYRYDMMREDRMFED